MFKLAKMNAGDSSTMPLNISNKTAPYIFVDGVNNGIFVMSC